MAAGNRNILKCILGNIPAHVSLTHIPNVPQRSGSYCGVRVHHQEGSPCHDDEEVQAIPRVPEVTSAAEDSQSHHLYNHLQREEDVDERIKSLKDAERVCQMLGGGQDVRLDGCSQDAQPLFYAVLSSSFPSTTSQVSVLF